MKFFVLGLFLLFLSSPTKAKAYLDPGSGSYLVQIIIAGVATGGIFFRDKIGNVINIFMKKIKHSDAKNNKKG